MKHVKVEKLGDKKWALLEDFVYESPRLGTITVPKGFITDFASVPRLFWTLYSPYDDDNATAGIVHDWLYYAQTTSRKKADEEFESIMEDQGVRWTKRHLMYVAVRAGGLPTWRRHAKNKPLDPDYKFHRP